MYLTQGLLRALQRSPDAIATIDGARATTWRETHDRVARLAGAFQGLGLQPGDRIAMLALNSDRFFQYLLASVWAGGAFAPVNVRWSAQEIAWSLDDCATRILLVDDAFLDLARKAVALSSIEVTLVHVGDGPAPGGLLSFEELIAAAAPVADADRSGDDLAAVMFTGGTTGRSKGVMLSHGNISASGLSYAGSGESAPTSSVLNVAPLFHVGCLSAVFANLMLGNMQAFLPAFDPGKVLAALAQTRVTDVFLVPTMLQMVLDHPDFAATDLSGLKMVTYGASPITDALLDRAMAAMPGVGFTQAYGMTELSPIATILKPSEHLGENRDKGRHRSAGRATMVTEVMIVDPDDNEVPRGETGEIVVRGANVMIGYWERPAETAEALRGGWMHTGDAGRMDADGYVYVVDRIKDMIVTGGENVYSAEVESTLSTHPAVAACAIVAAPDDKWIERVHAVVVLRPGAVADAAALQAHCRERIAGFKVPRSFEFREALPLSAAGKILKNVLRDEIRAAAKS